MPVFAALADSTRRDILALLARRERSVSEIVQRFEISQPAISRHLRVLREAGLVSRRGDGARRVYRLEPRGFGEIEDWVDRRRAEWNRRLDALEAHLERRGRRGERDTP